MKVQSPKQPPASRRQERFRPGTPRVTRKSDFARTKFISNAANIQASKWTIGSKPNASSNAGRFRAHRRANEWIRDLRCLKGEQDGGEGISRGTPHYGLTVPFTTP